MMTPIRRLWHEASGPGWGPLPELLLALTLVTGLVDAVSILALGRVFVANMTGNVVFSGFAIAGAPGFSLSASAFALAGFLAGAALGGRLTRQAGHDRALHLRAAEWSEATGNTRRAAHHYLAARQADQALALLQDRVVSDFLHVPTVPEPLVLNMADPSPLAETPEPLLGLAAALLYGGSDFGGGLASRRFGSLRISIIGSATATVLAWAALGVVWVVWGSTYLAIRVGDRTIPPLAMAAARYLIAGALLFPKHARRACRQGCS